MADQIQIEPSILSNPKKVDDMLDEVETLYAARFGKSIGVLYCTYRFSISLEGGDRKKARSRLRASFKQRSHHYSTFRTGIFIGLSIPALIAGIYEGDPSSFVQGSY